MDGNKLSVMCEYRFDRLTNEHFLYTALGNSGTLFYPLYVENITEKESYVIFSEDETLLKNKTRYVCQ